MMYKVKQDMVKLELLCGRMQNWQLAGNRFGLDSDT